MTVAKDLAGGTYKVATPGAMFGWEMHEVSDADRHGALLQLDTLRMPLVGPDNVVGTADDSRYEVRGAPVSCTLGQPCNFVMEGYGLEAGNAVHIIGTRGGEMPHFALHKRNFIPLLHRVSEIFLTPFKIAL